MQEIKRLLPPRLSVLEILKDTETRAHRREATGHRRPPSCLNGGLGVYPHRLPHRLGGAGVRGVAVVGPLQALACRPVAVVAVTDRSNGSIENERVGNVISCLNWTPTIYSRSFFQNLPTHGRRYSSRRLRHTSPNEKLGDFEGK